MNSDRLKPVFGAAEARERDALQGVADAQLLVAEQEARLLELQRYLDDYQSSGRHEPGRAMQPALLANRHAFMMRLQEAIRVQQAALVTARANCDAQRARWLLASRDTAVLAQLGDCYRLRERRAEERHTQRELDELALRRPGLPPE